MFDPNNVAVMDLDEETKKSAQMGSQRFKVEEGAPDAIILIVRRPERPEFCTDLTRFHWFNGGQDNNYRIPCGRMVHPPQPCLVCDAREQTLTDQSFNSLADPVKSFLNGSQGYDVQVLDLSSAEHLISQFQAARTSSNMPAATASLTELHKFILSAPVKLWNISPTLRGDFLEQLRNNKRQMGGQFVDPTVPTAVCPISVGKRKQAGKGFARYSMSVWWNIQFPLPEELFADDRVLAASDLYNRQFASQVGMWDAKRTLAVLEPIGLAFGSNVRMVGPADQRQQLAASPQPRAHQQAPMPVPQPMTLVAPAVVVGATASAAQPACFAREFDFKAAKCGVCGAKDGCVKAMMSASANSSVVQAAAAPMPVPPPAAAPVVAPAASSVSDDISAKIAALLAQAKAPKE